MKVVYIVSGRSTGCNGNIIHWTDCACISEDMALKVCDEMNQLNQDDPNYLAYVTGPVLLNEGN